MFYCPAQTQQTPVEAEPREQRGLTLSTLASRLQKQEAMFNPHMVACESVGYFTPQCYVAFLSFISLLCHPLPLLHYQNTDLPASFLAP
jgi:hypothetical protein